MDCQWGSDAGGCTGLERKNNNQLTVLGIKRPCLDILLYVSGAGESKLSKGNLYDHVYGFRISTINPTKIMWLLSMYLHCISFQWVMAYQLWFTPTSILLYKNINYRQLQILQTVLFKNHEFLLYIFSYLLCTFVLANCCMEMMLCVSVCVYTYVYVGLCMYVCMFVSVFVYMCLCVCVPVCLCVYHL